MSEELRIAAIVPCHNEEAAVAKVVADLKAAVPGIVVYVYDNRSTDATEQRALEAGAIFVKLDRLDGTAALYGPAPQTLADEAGERRFQLLLDADPLGVEDRVERELRFDSDLWLVEIENRAGDARLDIVES